MSHYLIPLTLEKGDKFIMEKGINRKQNWHKYTFGMLLLIAFVILDLVLILIYDKLLK